MASCIHESRTGDGEREVVTTHRQQAPDSALTFTLFVAVEWWRGGGRAVPDRYSRFSKHAIDGFRDPTIPPPTLTYKRDLGVAHRATGKYRSPTLIGCHFINFQFTVGS